MEKKKVKKARVLQKVFSTKDLFIINSYIEIDQNTFSGYPVCTDVIFLEFYNGYDRNTQVPMTVNSMELRRLLYACKEMIKSSEDEFEPKYENYTDPSLSSKSSNNGKKRLTVKKSKGTYYINLSYKGVIYKTNFDIYGILSFSDTLEEIAKLTDNTLYYYQRKMEMEVKKALKKMQEKHTLKESE